MEPKKLLVNLLDRELVQHPQREVGGTRGFVGDRAKQQIFAGSEIDLEETPASRIYGLDSSKGFTRGRVGRSPFNKGPQGFQEFFGSDSGG